MAHRPDPAEYSKHPFEPYVTLVPDGPIAVTLAAQFDETRRVYEDVTEARAACRYAPEKWSLKQVLGHLTDVERVFHYRALATARGDGAKLPSYDPPGYTAAADFDRLSWRDLLTDLTVVRAATVRLFEHFTPDMLARHGVVGAGERHFTVLACGFIVAGHERHHLALIRDRYLTL